MAMSRVHNLMPDTRGRRPYAAQFADEYAYTTFASGTRRRSTKAPGRLPGNAIILHNSRGDWVDVVSGKTGRWGLSACRWPSGRLTAFEESRKHREGCRYEEDDAEEGLERVLVHVGQERRTDKDADE